MLIPNSLRMEHMPQMVYALIKLAGMGEYTEDDLRMLITASVTSDYNDTSKDRFGLIFSFARDAGLLIEDNGYYKTDFTHNELRSFADFTYAMLGKMSIQKDNMFDSMLRFFLTSDQYIESEFTTGAAKFREKALEDAEVRRFRIEEDNVHGFFFWIEAFGIANFESNRSGHVYFCLEYLLLKYLKFHPEIRQMGSIPTKQFLNLLQGDLYFIPFCCEPDRNGITYALSQALRILDNMDILTLEYRQDSDQRWHLPKSEIFTSGNTFTNVRIL